MAAAIPFIIAGMSAYSALQQGQQQSAAMKQQAEAEERNQRLLTEQARTARQQAGLDEEAQRRQNRQFLATQRAAIGQSGIGFGGTPGLLQEDSAMQAELDALNIRYGGELQASNLLNQARESGISSSILKTNARQAMRGGIIRAGTSLLSSGYGMFGSSGRGLNMQGQSKPLYNNPAYVRNM